MIALAGGAWGNRDGLGADARFGHVAGMAVAPDGSLVVIDTGSIRRIDPIGAVRTEAKGVVTGETGGSPLRVGLWNYTMGAATDVDGAAVVVDYAAKRIVRVARDGRATELWHSGGLANALTRRAWGWRPTGVAMLGSSFYVLEELPLPPLLADLIGSPRLLHVERDGTTTRVVTVSGMLVRVAAALLLLTLLSWWRTARRGRRPAPGLAPPPRPSDAPPSHG